MNLELLAPHALDEVSDLELLLGDLGRGQGLRAGGRRELILDVLGLSAPPPVGW